MRTKYEALAKIENIICFQNISQDAKCTQEEAQLD